MPKAKVKLQDLVSTLRRQSQSIPIANAGKEYTGYGIGGIGSRGAPAPGVGHATVCESAWIR
jgi:hypothetical protein